MTDGIGGKLRAWAAIAALGVATGIGLVSFDLPPWAQKMAENWGPGFVILAALAAGVVHYVPRGVVREFVKAQQDQAVAMAGIKDTLGVMAGQNGKLDEISAKLDDLLINDRVIIRRIEAVERQRHEREREEHRE